MSQTLQTAAARANSYTESNTHPGTWAMRAVTTTSPTCDNAWQFPSVAPDSSYVAGCWLKGTGAVELRIFAGQWVEPPIANQTFTATSSWQFFPINNVNTGSNTQLTFNLTDSSGNAGTTYIDDCFLGLPGGANRLANPGFESGATGWSLNGTPFTILQNP